MIDIQLECRRIIMHGRSLSPLYDNNMCCTSGEISRCNQSIPIKQIEGECEFVKHTESHFRESFSAQHNRIRSEAKHCAAITTLDSFYSNCECLTHNRSIDSVALKLIRNLGSAVYVIRRRFALPCLCLHFGCNTARCG